MSCFKCTFNYAKRHGEVQVQVAAVPRVVVDWNHWHDCVRIGMRTIFTWTWTLRVHITGTSWYRRVTDCGIVSASGPTQTDSESDMWTWCCHGDGHSHWAVTLEAAATNFKLNCKWIKRSASSYRLRLLTGSHWYCCSLALSGWQADRLIMIGVTVKVLLLILVVVVLTGRLYYYYW